MREMITLDDLAEAYQSAEKYDDWASFENFCDKVPCPSCPCAVECKRLSSPARGLNSYSCNEVLRFCAKEEVMKRGENKMENKKTVMVSVRSYDSDCCGGDVCVLRLTEPQYAVIRELRDAGLITFDFIDNIIDLTDKIS